MLRSILCGSENSLLELAELIRAVATAGKHGAHQHVRREGVDIPRLKGDVATISFHLRKQC